MLYPYVGDIKFNIQEPPPHPPQEWKLSEGFIVSSSDSQGFKNYFKVTGGKGKPGPQLTHMCFFKTFFVLSGSPREALTP